MCPTLNLGLGYAIENFKAFGIETSEQLAKLSYEDYEILEINSFEHRRLLFQLVRDEKKRQAFNTTKKAEASESQTGSMKNISSINKASNNDIPRSIPASASVPSTAVVSDFARQAAHLVSQVTNGSSSKKLEEKDLSLNDLQLNKMNESSDIAKDDDSETRTVYSPLLQFTTPSINNNNNDEDSSINALTSIPTANTEFDSNKSEYLKNGRFSPISYMDETLHSDMKSTILNTSTSSFDASRSIRTVSSQKGEEMKEILSRSVDGRRVSNWEREVGKDKKNYSSTIIMGDLHNEVSIM